MKKRNIIILMFLLIVLFPFFSLAAILGDTNSDGKITTSDYILVRKHILGIKKLSSDELVRSDVNGDKKVNSIDYINIRKIIIDSNIKKVGTIKFSKDSISKVVGEQPFINKITVEGDGKITYKSSNSKIAVVNDNGKVTLKNFGKVTITATVSDTDNYVYKVKSVSYTINSKYNYIAYSQIASDKGPINTKEHFEYAGSINKYTALKGDVRPTKDDELIMCHDPGFTLENNKIVKYDSNNSILITDITKNQAISLYHKTKYNGKECRVIDFETFIKICAKYNKIAFITVRNDNVDVVVNKVMQVLNKYDMVDKSIINSFNYNTLQKFRDSNNNIMLSYVVYEDGFTKATVDKVEKLNNCLISLFVFQKESERENVLKKLESGKLRKIIDYAEENDIAIYSAINSNKQDGNGELSKYGISGSHFSLNLSNM